MAWDTDIAFTKRICRASQTLFSFREKRLFLFMAVFGMGTKTLRASCRGYPNRTWIFGGKRYAAINNVTKS